MSVPYYAPQTLWEMPPDEFNFWRSTNDIPLLLNFFRVRLPYFQQWMEEHGITDEVFCTLVPTGEWFKDNHMKLITPSYDDESKHGLLKAHSPIPGDSLDQLRSRISSKVAFSIEVEPYGMWARRKLGSMRFYSRDNRNPAKTAWPIFNIWSAVGTTYSRAMLLGEFNVLKVGGVRIGNMVNIGPRNLDFVDLDSLVIEGEFHGSFRAPINFSSCREIQLLNTQINFLKLYRCHLDKWTCSHSRMFDICFDSCGIFDINFLDSYLHRISFISSLIRPIFSNCEVREIEFIPSNEFGPTGIAEAYRQLRKAYQQAGQIQEAAEQYYLERTYRRKSLFFPYNDPNLTKYFPSIARGTPPRTIQAYIDDGIIPDSQRSEQIKLHWKFIFAVWRNPRSAFHAIKFKSKWLASLIDNIIWGYGERPLRIFGTAIFTIFFYASLYFYLRNGLHFGDGMSLHHSFSDYLYLSLVTFSTLGYGDITPIEKATKLLCGSEALMGAFILGLVVAGFANKSRY